MNKKILAICIILLLSISASNISYANVNQHNIIESIKNEYSNYTALAYQQLDSKHYESFVMEADKVYNKLVKMDTMMIKNSTVYFDLKDYERLSYKLYVISLKYDIDLSH